MQRIQRQIQFDCCLAEQKEKLSLFVFSADLYLLGDLRDVEVIVRDAVLTVQVKLAEKLDCLAFEGQEGAGCAFLGLVGTFYLSFSQLREHYAFKLLKL
jgi:hypothetical protein